MIRKILKKKYKKLCKLLLGGVAFVSSMFMGTPNVNAMPVLDTTSAYKDYINVVYNNGEIKGDVTNGFISWKDFSLNVNETLTFKGMTNMLNYVPFKNPSLIYGKIDASAVSGNFYIVNPSGILFGSKSEVLANDFYVSTRSLSSSDISSYLNNGSIPLFGKIDASRINDGGLKSSEIMGTYDIADGDVMFLGQVQANSLTVEGNTIQIRNTKNITNKSGDTILENDSENQRVTFYSNNPVEVGYEVKPSDLKKDDDGNIQVELTNPFPFDFKPIFSDSDSDETKKAKKDEFIFKIAEYYDIYLYKDANGKLITTTTDEDYSNNVYYSSDNYDSLGSFYDNFYADKISEMSNANPHDKLMAAFAMDLVFRKNIGWAGVGGGQIRMKFSTDDGANFSNYYEVNTLSTSFNDEDYQTALNQVNTNYQNLYGTNSANNPQYKYFIADLVGDKNMPNSANELGWTAKNLNGGSQKIIDYRLVNNADDLQYINFSKSSAKDSLLSMDWNPYTDNIFITGEGKIHGNYMLNGDIDLSSISKFKPLGYKMKYSDYVSESDQINFNGLNFKIKGLNTDSTEIEENSGSIDNLGLFSVFSGTVKNLRLENFNIDSQYDSNVSVGALIGTVAQKGGDALTEEDNSTWHWYSKNEQLSNTIKNVSLTGGNKFKGDAWYFGGLVGSMGTAIRSSNELTNTMGYVVYSIPGAPKLVFDNVENFTTGDINAEYSGSIAGGILGVKYSGNLFFKNSINNANVIATNSSGGFLGTSHNSYSYNYSENIPRITDKYNTTSFEKVANFGKIGDESTQKAGGLLGRNFVSYKSSYDSDGNYIGDEMLLSDSLITIKQSWNEGEIVSNENSGGIAGILDAPSNVDQVFNLGNIKGSLYAGGLFGTWRNPTENAFNATLTNSYNAGKVEGIIQCCSRIGGLIGRWSGGTISNVYNSGDVTGFKHTFKPTEDEYFWEYDPNDPDKEITELSKTVGGLIGESYSNTNVMKDSYNLGNVTNGQYVGGIAGNTYAGTFTNVYNAKSALENFGAYLFLDTDYEHNPSEDELIPTLNNVKNITENPNLNVSEIYSKWSIDTVGTGSNKTWRVYENLNDPNAIDRQPLLTAFLNDVTITRYNKLATAGSVDPADLVTTENPIKYTLHDSSGKAVETRLINTGKTVTSSDLNENGIDPSLVEYDIVKSHEEGKFSVDETDYLAEALMKSKQFGYNYKFNSKNDEENWTKDFTDDEKNDEALNSVLDEPATNTIYLKTVGVTAPTTMIDVNIKVGDGEIKNGKFTALTDKNGDSYTLSSDDDIGSLETLLSSVLTVVDEGGKGETTTVKIDESKLDKKLVVSGNTYTAVKDGKTYTFKKSETLNNTFTYTPPNQTGDKVSYTIKITPGKITTYTEKDATITLVNGKVAGETLTLDNKNGYSITGDGKSDITELLSGVLEVVQSDDGTATALKFNNKVTVNSKTDSADGKTTTYKVTKGGTSYEFTKDNESGSYTYIDKKSSSKMTTYTVAVKPGTLTYEVTVNVDDMKSTDNVVTSGGGYTVTNDNKVTNSKGVISELMNGKLEVVETADGLNTTLAAKDSTALTKNGNNYTYKDANNNIYNFTKNGDVYTYKADNGVTYEVTLEKGKLEKIYNIGIQVSDGVYYINSNGENTLSLELPDGYSITKNAEGSKFTDNFNVKYNDPVDMSKITGPTQTTVSVTNKTTNENYKTSDISATDGVYNSIARNADGTYTINATKDNITYNINIQSGLVVSDTRIPVKINVKDGKITDGLFSNEGYTITNDDIATLLQDKLEVVNVNGKTTVKFKDEVASHITDNGGGSYTYNDGTNTYNFSKNTDGTYTYSVTNPKGEIINYNVTIDAGDIATENNTNVIVKVNNGRLVDGNFTGNGYTVDNDVIAALLNGNLEVIKTDDNRTTVTVKNSANLTNNNGQLTYKAEDGKTYSFTKVGNNQYTYTMTDGNNTTNYNVQVVQGDIASTNNIPVTINIADGKVNNGVVTAVSTDGKGYTIDNSNISELLTGILKVDKNSDGTATTLKFNDGVTITGTVQNSDGTTTYNVTKGNTPYQFTKNTDGSYTYVDNSNKDNVQIYNVTLNPGTLTYEVKIQVGDIRTTDNAVTSVGGYTVISDNGNIIRELISGKLTVVETADGLNTILAARDSSALTKNGNNYTYKDANNNIYNFTKNGNVYTYKADNGVTYEVTVNPGDLLKTYNINIEVSDGVFYIDEDGKGNLSLNTKDGYKITKNADNSKFTDDFKVSYNEPLVTPGDTTQVTGPYKTTISITNTKDGNNTYTTNDFNNIVGGYNQITANADGSYSIAPITNGNITYNIKIKPGEVISDTRVPVTIDVNNGKLTDGVFTGNGYTITNKSIENLLKDKLEVVNVNGKTTVKFKDEVASHITDNGGGSYTYSDGTNTYNFNKNTDGTYTYSVTNPKGEIINYNVTIDAGDIATENNKDVKIKVNNGRLVNGNFTGNGYTVDNDVIAALLNGNLEVIKTDDNKTTVTVKNSANLTNNNGKLTYKAEDGKTYSFTKVGNNQYTYTMTDGNNTTNYNVQVVQGDISSTNNIPVTINIADGKVNNGVVTAVSTDGKGYTIDNNNISKILNGVLKVDKNSDGTATTLKFNDGVTITGTTKNSDGTTTYNVTKGNTPYQFTKNTDGSYTYVDNSNADNVQIYNVTLKPGTLTYEVKVQVGDMKTTDNVITSGGGYDVKNDNNITNSKGVISELMNGKLSVVETEDGLNTTLKAKDATALTNDGKGNYTYKDANNKIYNFTKKGDVYTYTADNGVTYEVTLEKGKLEKTYNIGIQVSDGVYYINADGEDTLSLELPDGYSITKNAEGSKFTDNFNVKYNDPVDMSQITGPTQTTVSVTNKTTNENYKTSDISATNGVYNSIAKNDDGSYTINATKDNVNYNINITSGLVISDTKVPVTINVKDGKLSDGVFTGNGYTITDKTIENLLKDKLEVVNVNGKTTVKFKDEVATYITDNGGGSYTYNDGTNTYNFSKNNDGKYTYSVTNPKGEIINYSVTINMGGIENYTNVPVKISVGDGKITDDVFSGGGYTISDPAFEDLIGKLTVIPTDNNSHTTIKIPTGENITDNGDGTYTYTYKKDDGGVIQYVIEVYPGNISQFKNEKISIDVGDGKIDKGTFTSDGYKVSNENVRKLLEGAIEVITKDNATTTLDFVDKSDGVFTDNGDGTFIYKKDGVNYPFTKLNDGTYTFTITGDDNLTTNYTVTIYPGTVTNYQDKNVSIQVGNGTLQDGTFTGSGYKVDDKVIEDLLSNELKVNYDINSRRTSVDFSNPDNLSSNGSNYTYKKNGVTYSFTKNADGTFSYTAKNGSTVTTYKVSINPGLLNITNTNTYTPPPETETPTTPETTPVTPATPEPTQPTITPTTEPTTTPTVEPTVTPTIQPTTTPTVEPTVTPTIEPTVDTTPEPVTITTPEPTEPTSEPVTTPEPTPEPVTEITTPEPTEPAIEPVTEPTPEPTPEPVTEITTPEPIEPTSEPVITPEPTPEPTENVTTPDNNVENPDYDLRSSKIEEFPEEKGDYIDLDARDHVLVETIDVKEDISKIEEVPDEFTEANTRNIVNSNNNNSLTSITESNITVETKNSDMGNELSEITTTENDSTSTTTVENIDGDLGNIEAGRSDSSQETDSVDQTSQETNSLNQNSETTSSQESNSDEQTSQKTNSKNQTSQKSDSDDDDDDDKDSNDSEEKKTA